MSLSLPEPQVSLRIFGALSLLRGLVRHFSGCAGESFSQAAAVTMTVIHPKF